MTLVQYTFPERDECSEFNILLDTDENEYDLERMIEGIEEAYKEGELPFDDYNRDDMVDYVLNALIKVGYRVIPVAVIHRDAV